MPLTFERVLAGIALRLNNALLERALKLPATLEPLTQVSGGPTVLTMCSERDLSMYLASITTFGSRVGVGRVVLLSDGSIGRASMDLLREVVPFIEFRAIKSVDTGSCQRGGCWERLCCLAELNSDSFVLQLDADMLTLRQPNEVKDAIQACRAFTMSGDANDGVLRTMRQTSANAELVKGDGFQVRVERQLHRMPESEHRFYVRGCAAFAGFPRATLSLNMIERIHADLESVAGRDVWRTWGSEQIACNTLVANQPDAVVLPPSEYLSHFGESRDFAESTMIHFIGSHRHSGGTYRRLGRGALAKLSNRLVQG